MATRSILSDDEIARYRRDGFLKPEYRLPEEKLQLLQALAYRLIRDNTHLGDAPMASPHIPGSGAQKLKSDPAWLEIPIYEPILDMVEQLIGPDIILWGTTLFYKPAGTGRIIPWHRDGRYWPIEPLTTTSVWIAVSDCSVENGCLRCLAGSHAAKDTGRHYRSDSPEVAIPETLHEDEYDQADIRDVTLEAGQMVIFDVYTAHGSNANRSDQARVGYALRFMPATSHYDHHNIPIEDSRGAAHHTRPLILARGVDRSVRNDFTIGHPRAAE